mmetsp:Transcript_21414/g.18996  ORF Transcript_21414/g.18996 Transcript_21414/m.18996 type:complete len:139 (-) Transcript_21414:418-834(-)
MAYRNNPKLNGFDYLLVRGSSMIILSFIQIYFTNVNISNLKKGYRFYLFLRSLLGGLGIPTLFVGLKYIPATKATLIYNVHPILVTLLAYFILREQLTKLKVLSVVGAFIGVILFTTNKNESTEESNYFIGIGLSIFT